MTTKELCKIIEDRVDRLTTAVEFGKDHPHLPLLREQLLMQAAAVLEAKLDEKVAYRLAARVLDNARKELRERQKAAAEPHGWLARPQQSRPRPKAQPRDNRMKVAVSDIKATVAKAPATPKRPAGASDKSPRAPSQTEAPKSPAEQKNTPQEPAFSVTALPTCSAPPNGNTTGTSEPVAADPQPVKPRRTRKKKPEALRKCYAIEVNVTLEHRDQIKKTADRLGLSASEVPPTLRRECGPRNGPLLHRLLRDEAMSYR